MKGEINMLKKMDVIGESHNTNCKILKYIRNKVNKSYYELSSDFKMLCRIKRGKTNIEGVEII